MTKDEALKLALKALEAAELDRVDDGSGNMVFRKEQAIAAIKEALAQPEQEPVKISHKHEWFRTGEMKVGQMRCISCGTWGQEEIPQHKQFQHEANLYIAPQRTWVGPS